MYHKGSWGQYYATHFLDDPELFSLIDRAHAAGLVRPPAAV